MLNLLLILFTILTPQEIERRTAIDFNKQLSDLLPYIQKYYPNVDSTQIAKWEESKALEYTIIDGKKWYFRRADENLFRIDPEAKALKTNLEGKERAGRDEVTKQHIKQKRRFRPSLLFLLLKKTKYLKILNINSFHRFKVIYNIINYFFNRNIKPIISSI